MVRRTRTAEPETEPAAEEPTAEEPTQTPEGGGDNDADENRLEGRIRAIVREVVGPLLENSNGNSRRAVDDEDETTRRVKSALDKLKADEERENRVKKVEETLQKVTERPPARSGVLGKVQRAMWGEE